MIKRLNVVLTNTPGNLDTVIMSDGKYVTFTDHEADKLAFALLCVSIAVYGEDVINGSFKINSQAKARLDSVIEQAQREQS